MTDKLLFAFLRWTIKNNVRPFRQYWLMDYSIVAYSEERLMEEFLKTI